MSRPRRQYRDLDEAARTHWSQGSGCATSTTSGHPGCEGSQRGKMTCDGTPSAQTLVEFASSCSASRRITVFGSDSRYSRTARSRSSTGYFLVPTELPSSGLQDQTWFGSLRKSRGTSGSPLQCTGLGASGCPALALAEQAHAGSPPGRFDTTSRLVDQHYRPLSGPFAVPVGARRFFPTGYFRWYEYETMSQLRGA